MRSAVASLAILLATAGLVAGCGGDDGDGRATAAEGGGPTAAASDENAPRQGSSAADGRGKLLKVVASDYGPVISDAKGEALYLFDKERGPRSRCFGECARVWPPVLTKGPPRAGKGAAAALLGTARRPNGRLQVTYDGHPLYYYVDDRPGLILCHDVAEFGGLWLVVRPDGTPA